MQIVCELKLISLILGIQTASAMHGCPYEVYHLNMTLKIHIILTHYKFYFEKMGKNFKETNGEFGETLHSTIKKFEAKKAGTLKEKFIVIMQS